MSDSTGGMTDLDDMEDIERIMQQIRYEESLQEQEAKSLNCRKYINCEHDIVEEHADVDTAYSADVDTAYSSKSGNDLECIQVLGYGVSVWNDTSYSPDLVDFLELLHLCFKTCSFLHLLPIA
ncbi:hypothetical protein Tco_0418805 [Tanacetum coccineum]